VPRISVVMPTYEQGAFIARALDSLLSQTEAAWEAIIVIDGSTYGTAGIVADFLGDPRFRQIVLPDNIGLGAALNRGLDAASGAVVAYLPTDDVYHSDHLATLLAALDSTPDAVAAVAGVRHHYNREALVAPPEGVQLVQVGHQRVTERWIERTELVSDDLDRLFWQRLRARGRFVQTNQVTCEWVSHPGQGSKVILEPFGGINPYRQRYRVPHPLRFHSSVGDRIDEVERYARFRDRPRIPPDPNGLHILLVGELAYNADRILALEERGHRLSGYWLRGGHWYNTVGPLPFGHVTDIEADDPREAVRQAKPDVIYALLNWQAVPFAAAVRRANPDVPFVWHYKEGPFISLEKGDWADLVDLTENADGVIHSSAEMQAWYETILPGRLDPERQLVLDGDLPNREWFAGKPEPRLSAEDGDLHTAVPGRPIGLHPETVAELAQHGIHLHFYGDFTRGQWLEWVDRARGLAPGFLHLHATVGQEGWATELARYDAGWLHVFRSRNGGELHRANWDDLNVPARMATYAAARLPMLQLDNRGSLVAIQSLALAHGVGILFESIEGLATQLRDEVETNQVRRAVEAARDLFTFDHHADRLVEFLRRAADRPGRHHRRTTSLAGTPFTIETRPLDRAAQLAVPRRAAGHGGRPRGGDAPPAAHRSDRQGGT
jgi:glycosyltransferase involved in cell wall biosynthesis